jgi:hypothetical protein
MMSNSDFVDIHIEKRIGSFHLIRFQLAILSSFKK